MRYNCSTAVSPSPSGAAHRHTVGVRPDRSEVFREANVILRAASALPEGKGRTGSRIKAHGSAG